MNSSPHDDWHHLFAAALNDQLSEAEQQQLTSALKESEEARRLWFLYHDVECGLAEVQLEAPLDSPSISSAVSERASLFRRWPLATAAACFAFGLFCASAVFAFFVPQQSKTVSLLHDSFESKLGLATSGMPREVGHWGGDFSKLTAAQQGITPATGVHMLRFLRGDSEGRPSPRSHSSDVFRLIDLRPYRQEFGDGSAVVQLTARFNAASVDPDAPVFCTLTTFALGADLANNPDLSLSRDSLAYSQSSRVWLDSDPKSWQGMSNELRVPGETDFLMIRVGVSYDVHQTHDFPDHFAGHFVDDVKLVLVHRPETVVP